MVPGVLRREGNVQTILSELLQEMHIRFQGNILSRPVIVLKNLKQVNGMDDYNEQFELLKNRRFMSKDVLLDHYLWGLKEEIVHGISLVEVTSLTQAMRLAKMQENLMNSTIYKKGYNHNTPNIIPDTNNSFSPRVSNSFSPYPYSVPTPPTKFLPPNSTRNSPVTSPRPQTHTSNINTTYQKPNQLPKPVNIPTSYPRKIPLTLTKAEMEDKRSRGLCFYCNDKFTAGHNCRNGKSLMTITVGKEVEPEEEEEVLDFSEYVQEEQEEEVSISVYALIGNVSETKGGGLHQTMKVVGIIKKNRR
ncbi:Retrotransposon gag protein [Quillaja saponaria]|uniref:Retrotransposon gag protein n=1 Tax=Quillaja saponaria TaxID=32244 RepID=A0AAD7LSH4_QUISA|nr:Retrotransposon gag protein [Quillaja saponaria]